MKDLILLPLALLLLSFLSGCGNSTEVNRTNNDRAYAVTIQGDGRIIAAGESYNGSNFSRSFALVRYNRDGTLDMSFGSGGKVLTTMGEGTARALVIQNDGKIVVAGYSIAPALLLLVRYNNNGSLDTTFGSGGIVQSAVGQRAAALAVALQEDGRIVAAGYSYNGSGNDFLLIRFHGNGTLDSTFGSGGIVTTRTTAYLITGSEVSSVAIQTDGRIVAAGGSYLIRYNSDGSLDSTFGIDGKVVTGSYYEQTSGVTIESGNKILAAGTSYDGIGSYDFALTRYNNDGSLDITFADSGRAVTAVRSLYPLSPATVALDPVTGRIVAAGFSRYQSVITRHNSDGTADPSFASGGKIIATADYYWGGANSFVQNIALQSDGRIVVAGSAYKDEVKGDDFALAQLNSNGSIDTAYANGGQVTTGF